jgi:hypothetical protein
MDPTSPAWNHQPLEDTGFVGQAANRRECFGDYGIEGCVRGLYLRKSAFICG